MKPKVQINRWALVATALAIALGVAMIGGRPSVAAQQGNLLVLDVVADPAALDLIATANGGPFYIPGQIFDPNTGDHIGDFHCWGFFIRPDGSLAVVSQEYDLFGRGKIQVQGVEDNGPRAVTGGTGAFWNARGEMITDLTDFPEFTVTFWLLGAGGK